MISEILKDLYGPEADQLLASELELIMKDFSRSFSTSNARGFSEKDSILIIYGDGIHEESVPPLQTLYKFCRDKLTNSVNSIHILPFYPFSSDDGFSVTDYKRVNPSLGSWDHVKIIGNTYRLMFDAVINHISVKSEWFKQFLKDDPKYKRYFICLDGDEDISNVIRPRNHPLLTHFSTQSGKKHVWTTFSADQADLNFSNPEVLFEIIKVILFYVKMGAQYIRLDAIAYLCKEMGTSCIHLHQTHNIVRLFRSVFDKIAPNVQLITETNVPHQDNISYFGNGEDEAHIVYNFTLPPLLLYTFYSKDIRKLSEWAKSLTFPSNSCTYLNFLASHDGIGVTPLSKIVNSPEIESMCTRVKKLGGHISYKKNPDGTESPYEMNINYLDALGDPDSPSEDINMVASRFLVTQAIMLSLRGIPGIYYHSLLGSRGWNNGVRQTGQARSINREKLERKILDQDLKDNNSLRHKVFYPYLQMLNIRLAEKAFHPNSAQTVLFCNRAVFTILRSSVQTNEHIICFHNVTDEFKDIHLNCSEPLIAHANRFKDIFSNEQFHIEDNQILTFTIAPYDNVWLKVMNCAE